MSSLLPNFSLSLEMPLSVDEIGIKSIRIKYTYSVSITVNVYESKSFDESKFDIVDELIEPGDIYHYFVDARQNNRK